APDGAGLLSANTSAGAGVGDGETGGEFTSVRLFDSPVQDFRWQPGPAFDPLSTSVRTCSVAPLLNVAWLELPLPKTLNSASFHLLPRSEKRLSPFAVCGTPDSVTTIPSFIPPPGEEPWTFNCPSAVIGCEETFG